MPDATNARAYQHNNLINWDLASQQNEGKMRAILHLVITGEHPQN